VNWLLAPLSVAEGQNGAQADTLFRLAGLLSRLYNNPQGQTMPEQSDDDSPGPSLASLILRGVLIILAAFVSANVILVLHAPVGH